MAVGIDRVKLSELLGSKWHGRRCGLIEMEVALNKTSQSPPPTELLGQVYLNKHLVYLTERFCMQNDDANKPHALYRRDGQKSICVTNLVAALEVCAVPQIGLRGALVNQ